MNTYICFPADSKQYLASPLTVSISLVECVSSGRLENTNEWEFTLDHPLEVCFVSAHGLFPSIKIYSVSGLISLQIVLCLFRKYLVRPRPDKELGETLAEITLHSDQDVITILGLSHLMRSLYRSQYILFSLTISHLMILISPYLDSPIYCLLLLLIILPSKYWRGYNW